MSEWASEYPCSATTMYVPNTNTHICSLAFSISLFFSSNRITRLTRTHMVKKRKRVEKKTEREEIVIIIIIVIVKRPRPSHVCVCVYVSNALISMYAQFLCVKFGIARCRTLHVSYISLIILNMRACVHAWVRRCRKITTTATMTTKTEKERWKCRKRSICSDTHQTILMCVSVL